jgi:uncharacterized protein
MVTATTETERRSAGQRRRRERERRVRSVHLHSGALLDLQQPDAAVITLRDVAVALARTGRFPGTAPTFHSVAHHSAICAERARDLGHEPRLVMGALLHDVAELGLSDIPTPVKAMLRGHRKVEAALDEVILRALGLPADLPLHDARVKEIDRWCLAVEVRDLLHTTWEGVPPYRGPRLVLGLTARDAQKAFLREYSRCKRDLTS